MLTYKDNIDNLSQSTLQGKESSLRVKKPMQNVNTKSQTKLTDGRRDHVLTSSKGSVSSTNLRIGNKRRASNQMTSSIKNHTSSTKSIDDFKKNTDLRRSSEDLFKNTSNKKPTNNTTSTNRLSSAIENLNKKSALTSQATNLPPKVQSVSKLISNQLQATKGDSSKNVKQSEKPVQPKLKDVDTVQFKPTVVSKLATPSSKVDSGSKAASSTVSSRLQIVKNLTSQGSSNPSPSKPAPSALASLSHKKPKRYEFSPLFK